MQLDRPLRVGFTIGPPGHGGIGMYARELAAAITARDDIELITIGSEAALHELRAAPSGHIRCRGGRAGEQAAIAMLGMTARRRRLDLVHGTRHVVPLSGSTPSVLTFHDDFALTRRAEYDLGKRWLLPPVYRRSIAAADAVVTLSAGMADEARRHVGATVPVVNAGAAVSTELAQAVAVPPATTLPEAYAVVVGDAGRRKRVDRLLDRWDAIEEATGLTLVVAGGRAAWPELVDRLDTSPAVFVRQPTAGELVHLYTHASVVVDAAAAEGFGFPRVEADWFGVPYALLGDDVDPVTAIDEARSSHATRRAADDIATWPAVAERTVEVYRRVLKGSIDE
jgi:glycosyltransferase involved in cell wall biosynthesis